MPFKRTKSANLFHGPVRGFEDIKSLSLYGKTYRLAHDLQKNYLEKEERKKKKKKAEISLPYLSFLDKEMPEE